MYTRITGTAIVICCLLPAFQCMLAETGTTIDPAAKAKERFDFEKLPGRDGPVYTSKGLEFAQVLKEYGLKVRHRKERYLLGRGLVTVYRLQREASSPQAQATQPATRPATVGRQTLRVYVAASPRDAHEMLFSELGKHVRNIRVESYLDTLERTRIVGDFCIVTKEPGFGARTIRFARGSVAVSIRMPRSISRNALIELAQAIDRKVQKQASMTDKEMATLPEPQVKAKNVGPVTVGARVEIPVVLSGPLGKGQSVAVVCDYAPRGVYNPRDKTAICTPRLPGLHRIGIGVHDKESGLTRWAVVKVEVVGVVKDKSNPTSKGR